MTEKHVLPARTQSEVDRICAHLSSQCDDVRPSVAPDRAVIYARPKPVLDAFGEPLPPPYTAELDAPEMVVRGIASKVEINAGLDITTRLGFPVRVEWLAPRR